MKFNFDVLSDSQPVATDSLIVSDNYSVEGCDLPISFYEGDISQEGWISNIVEWFRKKQEEAKARKKAMEKRQWQEYLEGNFNDYIDLIDSMSPSRLASKEVQTYNYNVCIKHCEQIAGSFRAFMSLRPMHEKSFISFLRQIENKVKPFKQTLAYNKDGDSLVYYYLKDRKVVKLKGSKWDNPSAMRMMLQKVMTMDDLFYQICDMSDNIIDEYNAWYPGKTRGEVDTVRRCVVAFASFTDGLCKQEAVTCKQLIANMNSIIG